MNIKLSNRKGSHKLRTRDVKSAQTAANSFCLRTYGVGYTAGPPQRLILSDVEFWIVPVLFTSSGYGIVAQAGVLAMDFHTHEVVGATPQAEVRAEGARLAKENRHDLDTAFYRARTT